MTADEFKATLHPLTRELADLVEQFRNSQAVTDAVGKVINGADLLPTSEQARAFKDVKKLLAANSKPFCNNCCGNAPNNLTPGTTLFKDCVNQCLRGTGPCR